MSYASILYALQTPCVGGAISWVLGPGQWQQQLMAVQWHHGGDYNGTMCWLCLWLDMADNNSIDDDYDNNTYDTKNDVNTPFHHQHPLSF
eukprot:15340402-Ditylum_brightwellii.AAC.1